MIGKRGGLHRLPWASKSEGADEHLTTIETESFGQDDPEGGQRFPELQGGGDDAAQGGRRRASTTGRRSSGTTARSTNRCSATTWRSTTGSAAATASPPGVAYGLPRRQGAATGRRIRRGARRAGHDDARRHIDGTRRGGRSGDEGQGRPPSSAELAVCIGRDPLCKRPWALAGPVPRRCLTDWIACDHT